MRHHLPALGQNNPSPSSPTMRSFLCKNITIPVGFKAIRCRRRALLWNRQALIITDLTMLAFRNGWCCFPISVPVLVMPSASLLG